MYSHAVGHERYRFAYLRTRLARASPPRSGDQLAGLAARSEAERVVARFALADVPAADERALAALAPGLMPEMAAAVSKLMRLQDLVLVIRKCRVVTRFRTGRACWRTPRPPRTWPAAPRRST